MLRVLQHIPKNLVLVLALAALGRVREGLGVGREGLRRQRGEGAPGVELAAGPVQLRGTDVPAAEDGVRAVGARPVGQEGRLCGGELAVADVGLVLEGVVLGDELVGAEVGGLEEAPLGAVLPCPGDAGGVGEGEVEVALGRHVLVARARRLHEVVYDADEGLPRAPLVGGEFGPLGLGPAVFAGDLGAHGVRLHVVAEVAQAPWGTV